MAKYVCLLVVGVVIITLVIAFSESFRKFAERYDNSPLGGKGTDGYVSVSLCLVVIAVVMVIYSAIKLYPFVFYH